MDKIVIIDGTNPERGTIQVDHVEQIFVVKVSALSSVGYNTLKDSAEI